MDNLEKWFIKNKTADIGKISKEFKIPEFTAQLLINRDINTPRLIDSYLNPSLDRLYSPMMFSGMDKTLEILKEIKDKKEKIRIVGDYDVDGVMSTYILKKTFDDLGILSDYKIPSRVEDGYGINKAIIKEACDQGMKNIITCDNGIAAIEEIDYAKELGMTIIITDHHDLPFKEEDGIRTNIIPRADSIINPKKPKESYPFDKLCGAGICFKLSMALYDYLGFSQEEAFKFLEFAAIATVCDVVDLIDENRIIVSEGLKLINKTSNLGLKALLEETDLLDSEIGVYHLGFVIGPSINASGRLDSAVKALDLFLTNSETRAQALARELKGLNESRKEMTERGTEEIIRKIETSSLKEDTVLLVYEPSIHESVAGIIAGRIKDRYHKPTIVLTRAKEGIKGSARSIEAYNIFEELTKRKKYLGKFGGHPMAAGLSLEEDNIEALRKDLNNNDLTKEDLTPRIYMDMALSLDEVSFTTIMEIERLAPFGKGNSKPLFGTKNVRIKEARILGKNKNVLKLGLVSPSGIPIEGMIFNDVEGFQSLIIDHYGRQEMENLLNGLENQVKLDLVFYPSINEFRGKTTLQSIIESYRISK